MALPFAEIIGLPEQAMSEMVHRSLGLGVKTIVLDPCKNCDRMSTPLMV